MTTIGALLFVLGLGTLYMVGHHPGISDDLWYRVFHGVSVAASVIGAVLLVIGVITRVNRWIWNRLFMRVDNRKHRY